jgi:uncharacterized membrane protein
VASRRSRQVARAEAAKVAQSASLTVSQTYSGPLPAPEDLVRYDAIVPGMAERLLTKFEKQADHRMDLERHVIYWDVRRANAGLLAAFVFGVIVLLAAVWLIVSGYESAGVTAIVVEFLAFAAALLYSTERRRRERDRKSGNS